MQPTSMLGLLGRICPMQKDDKPREEEVYRTPEEFDAALKARGLPTLTHVLALEYDHTLLRSPPHPDHLIWWPPWRA